MEMRYLKKDIVYKVVLLPVIAVVLSPKKKSIKSAIYRATEEFFHSRFSYSGFMHNKRI